MKRSILSLPQERSDVSRFVDKEFSLPILWGIVMGFLAILPVGYPEAVQSLWWRIAALLVFLLGAGIMTWHGRYMTKQKRERQHEDQKRQLEQAQRDADSGKRFDELRALFQQSQRTPTPSENPSLKERVQQLADDLFTFLKEKGPEAPTPSLKANDAEYREMFDAYYDYVHKVYFGYMAHFRDRVVKIDNELAELGIMTGLTLREIDPPQDTREVNVRKIAESLLLTATKMN